MGGSASSELATGQEGIKKDTKSMTNVGLLNLADNSGMQGGFDFNLVKLQPA